MQQFNILHATAQQELRIPREIVLHGYSAQSVHRPAGCGRSDSACESANNGFSGIPQPKNGSGIPSFEYFTASDVFVRVVRFVADSSEARFSGRSMTNGNSEGCS
jgi:hypothetical protein